MSTAETIINEANPLPEKSAWDNLLPKYRSENVGWSKKGDFYCPFCSTSIGRNLLDQKPVYHVAEHMDKHRCDICHQPIQYGENYDTFHGKLFHENPDVCVYRAAFRAFNLGRSVGAGVDAVEMFDKEFPRP